MLGGGVGVTERCKQAAGRINPIKSYQGGNMTNSTDSQSELLNPSGRGGSNREAFGLVTLTKELRLVC